MSVQRCQCEISSSEFMDWIVYLDEEMNLFHREDFFLAQIATEIRRSFVKDPSKVKFKDFLIQFKKKVEPKKLSIEERSKRSKAFWGVTLDEKFKHKRKK